MASVGDKYVIEIEEVLIGGLWEDQKRVLYRIKGFNSLVFDEHGLSKLEKYEESVCNSGASKHQCWGLS